jgi:thioredoxin 1
MSNTIETFDDANFEQQVLKSETPVLVDFWASWCRPCIAMAPDLEAVAEQFAGQIRIGKLNVEDNTVTANTFGVTALPTLLLLKGGHVAEQRVGKQSKSALVKLVESNL